MVHCFCLHSGYLLAKFAKQLELCVFTTCKMMQVPPQAVKRMLLDQFYESYPEVKWEEDQAAAAMAAKEKGDQEGDKAQSEKAVGQETEAMPVEKSTRSPVLDILGDLKDIVMNGGVSLFSALPKEVADAMNESHPSESSRKKTKMSEDIEEDVIVSSRRSPQRSRVRSPTNQSDQKVTEPTMNGKDEGKKESDDNDAILQPAAAVQQLDSTKQKLKRPVLSAIQKESEQPVKKKIKAELSAVQEEVKAYVAKKKRAKKGKALVVTLNSHAMAAWWAEKQSNA